MPAQEMKQFKKPKMNTVSYYQVTVFGVGADYKEYCRVIWKGIATDEESAINRAVNLCYEKPHREFMKPYLKAHPCREIELNEVEKQLVSDAKEFAVSRIKAVTKNHEHRINTEAYEYMAVAISPGVERYWRTVVEAESAVAAQ